MILEQEAAPKMKEFLRTYGLQITLKTLIDALEEHINNRGKFGEGLLVLEVLKGLLVGYRRRYEAEEE